MIDSAVILRSILILIIFFIGGCGAYEDHDLRGGRECVPAAEQNYCRVSMVSLIAHPERYAGNNVSVSGFLASGSVPQALYLSREAWLSGDTASSITVAAADERVKEVMGNSEATFVVLSGSINSQSDQGAMGGRMRMDVERIGVLFKASETDMAERKMTEGFESR